MHSLHVLLSSHCDARLWSVGSVMPSVRPFGYIGCETGGVGRVYGRDRLVLAWTTHWQNWMSGWFVEGGGSLVDKSTNLCLDLLLTLLRFRLNRIIFDLGLLLTLVSLF